MLAVLIGFSLLTPLLFLPNFYLPLLSAKIFGFVLLSELAFPLLIWALMRHKEIRPLLIHPLVLTLCLSLAVLSVSAALGVDPWNSYLGNAARMDGLFLSYHLLVFFLSLVIVVQLWKSSHRFFLRLFLAVAAMVGLIGILQFVGLLPSASAFESRASSTIGNPVFFAASLIIPFFLSLGMAVREKPGAWKWLYGLFALLSAAGIIASGTRGAYLGALAGLFVWGVLHLSARQKKGERTRLILPLFAVFAALCLLLLAVRGLSTAGSIPYRVTHFADASVTSRLTYWRLAVVGWQDAPWLGVGHQNFYRIADTFYPSPLYETSGNWPDKPHNQFLEILATGGVLSFASTLVFLFFIVKNILARPREEDWIAKEILVSAFVAYLVQNFFVFNTIVPLVSFYVFVALLFWTPRVNPEPLRQGSRVARVLPFLAVIVPIGLGLLFLLPAVKQFYLFGQVLTQDQGNPQAQANHLEEVSRMPFIYDRALLANLTSDTFDQELAIAGNTALAQTLFLISQDAYQHTLTRHPNRAYSWYRSARLFFSQAVATGERVPEQAFTLVREAIRLAPTRVEALIVLSNMYAWNGELVQANETIDQALRLAPNHPDALFTLALVKAQEGDIAQAAPLAVQSLKNKAQLTNADALNWVINYYVEQGDTATVVYLYETAVATDSQDAQWLPKLAAAYAANGQIQEALETALTYGQLHPEEAAAVEAFLKSLSE